MSFKLTLKSLLSETRKMVKCGPQKIDYFKEEAYRIVSQSYSKLNQVERYEYLRELSLMHDYNKEKLYGLKSQDTTSDALRIRKMYNIKEALQPKYREFFINLGRVPDGIKLLVDLRSDIIDIQQMITTQSSRDIYYGQDTHFIQRMVTSNDATETAIHQNEPSKFQQPQLEDILHELALPENSSSLFVLNAELKDLITVWFAGGFCNLERVTWNSSCHLLQRISELEAVHPIKGWADIKRRVGAYRRCYVFTHPCMPTEPVVILHTALCAEIPASIRDVVQRRFSKSNLNVDEDEDLTKIKAAIFYSISSPHTGLQGVDLGNTLIKRVVQTLLYEFPTLNQFSTLSPVPGFRRWLDRELERCLNYEINSRIIQNESEAKSFQSRVITSLEIEVLSKYFSTSTVKDLLSRLQVFLDGIAMSYNSSTSLLDLDQNASNDYILLSWFLKRMAAKYLVNEKHRGFALDYVCNFHLRNGAVIWRINWLADSSPRGILNSYGIMVNYRYYIEQTETNSHQYMENKTIECSSEVKLLLHDTTPKFTSNKQ